MTGCHAMTLLSHCPLGLAVTTLTFSHLGAVTSPCCISIVDVFDLKLSITMQLGYVQNKQPSAVGFSFQIGCKRREVIATGASKVCRSTSNVTAVTVKNTFGEP